jgi:hypothetical protein
LTLTAEPPPKARPIFGQITLEDMRGNELLTKTVMPLVGEVCKFSKGRFKLKDVAAGVASGEYQVWGTMRPPATLDAVAVTTVRKPAFEILLIGPNPSEITPFLPAFMAAAREARCQRLAVFGSPRWRNHFGEGWRMLTVYERDV